MPKKFKLSESPYCRVLLKDVKEGDTFWRLTVLGRHTKRNHLLCRCECGTERSFYFYSIRKGSSKSCGCLSVDNCRANFSTHNLRHHKLYNIWASMKARCLNVRNPAYNRYGGAGVSVDPSWLNDFKTFYDWAIANNYDDRLSLDRIDARGDYEPANCRWSTRSTQAQNSQATLGRALPKGVSVHSGKFRACITQNYKTYYLGVFETANEARKVYYAEAMRRFGVCYEAFR